MTLTGLEEIQKVYKDYKSRFYNEFEKEYSEPKNLCSLIIVLYFQDLIKKSAPIVRELNCPLLATSNDYNFVYEYGK